MLYLSGAPASGDLPPGKTLLPNHSHENSLGNFLDILIEINENNVAVDQNAPLILVNGILFLLVETCQKK